MKLSEIKSGRLEVAVCLLAPLLVLACIAVPGHLFCRNLRQDLQVRQSCLDQIPVMERQLAATRQVLQPFAVASVEGDKAAELTLVAEKAAQAFGFVTRSANVGKEGVGGMVDYRVVINGDGTLKSIIGMIDHLEHPSQRFRVSQVTLQAKRFVPEPSYDGSVVLVARTLSPDPPSVADGASPIATAERGAELTGRLAQLTRSVASWAEEKRAPLAITLKSDDRKEWAKTEGPKQTSLFVLNGIVRDGKTPLALTDQGVFGVGEEVNGFKIEAIGADTVSVVNKEGRREVVKLYNNGGGL